VETGEAAYNTQTSNIERGDNGFYVTDLGTGRIYWYPDTQIRCAGVE
jgi:hypothetical protein